MDKPELAQKIRDFMIAWYKATYIGRLEVTKDDTGYMFLIGIPSYMAPTTITADFDTDDEFLNFICKELKTRNYIRQYVYKVTRTENSREE